MTRRRAPANPWLKKNPLLSIWLSAANSMLGVARGQMSAAVARGLTSAAVGRSARAAAAATTTGGTARKPAAKRRSSPGTGTRRKRP